MLTIYPQSSASDVKKYFSTADYYAEGQETVGRWGGKLAAMLGLRGQVDQQSFERLCDNLHPVTAEPLTARTNDHRRVGYDMVFSGPKSFSIIEALAGESDRRALLRAFDDSIHETLLEMEGDMHTRVRKGGAFHDRRTGSMCWAEFDHSTSRPLSVKQLKEWLAANGNRLPGWAANDSVPPDMQRHKHVFVFNATEDAVEQQTKAGEFSYIKRDGEYFTGVFYSRLAAKLEAMGFAIDRRGGKEWEIAGIPQSMIETFSKRTDEIEAEAAAKGITNGKLKAELGAKTRAKKEKHLTPKELRGQWYAQLTDPERRALAKVLARQIPAAREVTGREAVAFAIDHCSEKLSVVPERELLRVAMLAGLGSLTPEQVAAELPRQGVIADMIDGRRMATTEALQREEDYIAGVTANGRGMVMPVGVAAGLNRLRADGKLLNDGQWEAVQGLLSSSNRVNLVEGPAGAGKSSMLGKFDEGMRRAGQSVTYLATTAKAAEVLQEDGFQAVTLAHFLRDEKMQAAARGGRVVVDEVSMLGHKDAVRFFQLVESHDLKPVFVGDPMQHGAVPRGAFLHVLKEYGLIQPFKLREILRQKDAEDARYLAAATQFSEGRTAEGFDTLDAMGGLKEIVDDEERNRRIADDYLHALADKKSVLVVSPTHAEARGITAAIRAAMRAAGKLGKEEIDVARLVPVDTSEAERTLATTYRPGDVIQFHQNAKGGFTKGDRLIVTDPAKVPVQHAEKFSLYRPESVGLAAGDKIRFTGTVKTLDGEHTLKNGMTRSVVGFTGNKNIKLDNGWIIAADAGHFRHGFVETSFGAQGRTVQRAILAASSASLPAAYQEMAYVSSTRAKERMTLYTDDKDGLKAAIQRSSRKLAALDLKRPNTTPAVQPAAKPQKWHRQRKHAEQRRRLILLDRTRSGRDRPGRQTMPPDAPPRHVDPIRQPERSSGYER